MITLEKAPVLVDRALAKHYCSAGEQTFGKGLDLYKKVIPLLPEEEKEEVIKEYRDFALIAASKLAGEKKWGEVLELYRDVMAYPGFPATVFKNVGLCLSVIKSGREALEFFEMFQALCPNEPDIDEYIGEVASEQLQDYPMAIEHYEKALKNNPEKALIYSQLTHLYSTLYRDRERDKQLYYAEKSVELDPTNRITVKNAAFVFGKLGEIEKADELYGKLMTLNPTHSDLHSYGAYLVRNKRFKSGFRFLRHRFQKEDLNGLTFPKCFYGDKVWNEKTDLTGKNVLVYFEQGFGDTIMFSRYIKMLKGKCKKVNVIVQPALKDLLQDSKIGATLYTEDEANAVNLQYDVVIPMMDLPLLFGTTFDSIPTPEGWLKVARKKVKEYGDKYIGDKKKFKIGIAFEGSAHSKVTKRDIPLKFFYPLMQLPNVDVYILQVDDLENQLAQVPSYYNYINLGKTFKNWEDTACAIENMDLIITSDNGVMNLAGALGKKTFGMFNSITEWRWFKTDGEDIAWYKSIKPFQCASDEEWLPPMNKAIAEVKGLAS